MDASPFAVEFLYELNRARNNPAQYASDHSWNNQVGQIAPAGPLALSESLLNSAQAHASEMSLKNYLAHQSLVDGRWPNRMARDAGYSLPPEFDNESNSIESIAAGASLDTPSKVLQSWFEQSDALHSANVKLLMGTEFPFSNYREAGFGHAINSSTELKDYAVFQAAYQSVGDIFLTGVVYDDRNGNRAYNAGEGIAGVTIQVGPFSTTTHAAGDWSIRVGGGLHQVVASGGGLSAPLSTLASVLTNNVEVDFAIGRPPQVDFEDRSEWTNPLQTLDVNRDGLVTPLDALIVINSLNLSGSRSLPPLTQDDLPPPYYDTSGDHWLTPLDALLVINGLNGKKR